jgi:hypothetical protein
MFILIILPLCVEQDDQIPMLMVVNIHQLGSVSVMMIYVYSFSRLSNLLNAFLIITLQHNHTSRNSNHDNDWLNIDQILYWQKIVFINNFVENYRKVFKFTKLNKPQFLKQQNIETHFTITIITNITIIIYILCWIYPVFETNLSKNTLLIFIFIMIWIMTSLFGVGLCSRFLKHEHDGNNEKFRKYKISLVLTYFPCARAVRVYGI